MDWKGLCSHPDEATLASTLLLPTYLFWKVFQVTALSPAAKQTAFPKKCHLKFEFKLSSILSLKPNHRKPANFHYGHGQTGLSRRLFPKNAIWNLNSKPAAFWVWSPIIGSLPISTMGMDKQDWRCLCYPWFAREVYSIYRESMPQNRESMPPKRQN